MGGRVEVEGMRQLREKLQALGNRAKTVENQAIRAGAEVIRAGIAEYAPRSSFPRLPSSKTQTWRTGEHAADNIKLSGIKQQGGAKFVAVGIQPNDNSHYFYLKFIEYGTSKMSAQPFMQRAIDAKQLEALQQVKNVLAMGLGLR